MSTVDVETLLQSMKIWCLL